ncbi:MAG: hypothetical protein AB7O66_05450 [Limisphaerales bacterium]
MPQRLAQVSSSLTTRKRLLVALSRIQRQDFQDDLASTTKSARSVVDDTRRKAVSGGLVAALAILAGLSLSAMRRPRRRHRHPRGRSPIREDLGSSAPADASANAHKGSLVTTALPILKLLVSLWLARRAGSGR